MEAREATEHAEKIEEGAEHQLGRRVAVLVGALAALLAVASLAGNQASEEIVLSQEKATDSYNEYQADSLKARLDLQVAGILDVVGPGSQQGTQSTTQAAELRKEADEHYGPKLQELLDKAGELERERDTAEHRHRSLQLSEAGLQIGIVLASIAIVARIATLAFVAGAWGRLVHCSWPTVSL